MRQADLIAILALLEVGVAEGLGEHPGQREQLQLEAEGLGPSRGGGG